MSRQQTELVAYKLDINKVAISLPTFMLSELDGEVNIDYAVLRVTHSLFKHFSEQVCVNAPKLEN